MFIRAPRRSLIVFVPQQRPAQACHGPHHAHHSAARAVASRDASPVDMSLRRAALEVCSTSGRSLLPRALGGAEAWTAAPPASLWTQTRGKKKSTRRVEVVLHQVRAARTPRPPAPRKLLRASLSRVSERDPIPTPRAPRTRSRPPARPRMRNNLSPPTRSSVPSQDIEGLGRDGEIVSVRPGRARNHLVPNRIAVYANADKLEDAARRRAVWEGEIAEDADAGDDAAREVRVATRIASARPPRSTRTLAAPRVFARTRRIRGSISRRLDAVMSNYYFGLEFLKAYPGVYTTVFPWLSERPLGPARLAPRIHPSPRVGTR